jgi:hypothetical protein
VGIEGLLLRNGEGAGALLGLVGKEAWGEPPHREGISVFWVEHRFPPLGFEIAAQAEA